jgi:hypothetical protein
MDAVSGEVILVFFSEMSDFELANLKVDGEKWNA